MTKIIKTQDALKTDKDYQNLLQELKSILLKGQHEAYKAVDNIKVQAYWQTGERIVREELKYKDRAGYGDFIVANLVKDLQIKRQELYKIIKFYRLYEIVGSVTRQLSWTHYYYLVDINDNTKRSFYQNKAVTNSWSYRELRKQIKSNLYENTPRKEIEEAFKTKLPVVVETQEVFKNDYHLKFMELSERMSMVIEICTGFGH